MELNSNIPMELLANIPARLNKNSLETIQAVIDNDKLICDTMLGRDLCGEYAPFCALCDKSMRTPCAIAYIRLKQAEQIQLEVAVSDDESNEQILTDFSRDGINVEEVEEQLEINIDEIANTKHVEIEPVQNEASVVADIEVTEANEEKTVTLESEQIDDAEAAETDVDEQSQDICTKNSRIRIAVAKRKK